jgi:hypothetical protein
MKVRLERVALVAGMAVASISLWTAAPLLGLWVGSRVAPSSGISMGALLAVVATIGFACWLLVRALGAMGRTYDGLTGRTATVRRHTPWLRSMSGEREHGQPGADAHLTPWSTSWWAPCSSPMSSSRSGSSSSRARPSTSAAAGSD